MKLLSRISLFTFCFIIISCRKDNDHGNVLVTVKYNGKSMDQPTIYMKKGTLTNPNIPLTDYDKSMSGDAAGQATFEDLAPGDYFFFAQAYSNSKGNYASGENSVTVKSRNRENSYEVTINCN